MKAKKIEIFQNKRGLIGCKWSSLNIFFSGLNDFPFSHYSHRTSISLSDKIPLALALPFIERLRRANKNLSERSFQSSNFWLCIYVLRLRKKGNSIVWLPRCNPSWKFRRESIVFTGRSAEAGLELTLWLTGRTPKEPFRGSGCYKCSKQRCIEWNEEWSEEVANGMIYSKIMLDKRCIILKWHP